MGQTLSVCWDKLDRIATMGIEYSAHLPSEFIATHIHELIPDWWVPALSVLIIFQRCPVPLIDRSPATETQKDLLRDRFIQYGHHIARSLTELTYLTEIFDPRTGLPLLSSPGSMPLDDVAVVRSLLGYPLVETGGCWILEHPHWGTGVFPAVILSSAPPEIVLQVVAPILVGEPVHSL